jgi:hypothetical protein
MPSPSGGDSPPVVNHMSMEKKEKKHEESKGFYLD